MNWALHFQAVSSGAPTASFGTTLFGKYTIAELQSLINSKDDEIAGLAKSMPGAPKDVQSDFEALRADYGKTRASAAAIIASTRHSLFDDDLNPAGDAPYRAVLATFNPNWEKHDASTSRTVAIVNRLRAAGKPVVPYTVRQPQAQDDAANWMLQQPLDYFVADPGGKLLQKTGDAAHAVADWTRPILIALGVIAAGLGFVLIKTYLPPPPRQLGTLGAKR